MSLLKDYFLLYHSSIVIPKKENAYSFKPLENNEFYEISALILCTTERYFVKFGVLESFKELISKISEKNIKTREDLYQLQYSIVETIENEATSHDISLLREGFEYLKKEEILNKSQYKRLLSLFDPEDMIEQHDEIDVEEDLNIGEKELFKNKKKELENLIKDLRSVFTTKEFIEELEQTAQYLSNQKFSIGITGVMNAGKSTMLNALMGQEILGTSVVPETANLTIVKYGKPEARVFYWNKLAWQRIINSAKSIESIKKFVDETKEVFKEELDSYILDESYNENVDIHNLSAFTSAQTSGKKCNLVKYVELKTNLNFLKDGIEIVDTPGLDDPVIQREEITKEYISQCDLMIHLMNVRQSATLKDIEFIIDAILYQNITNLLIVITRADTVSKEQLNEAIAYTKSSIKAQLKEQNKDSQLDFILQTIKFIPISGKMALYHRTGKTKEAIDAGFYLEDTGILEIEAYLHDTLFGNKSTKSYLILKSVKQQILRVIEKEIKSLNYELYLLSKSKEELKEDLKKLKNQKEKNQNNLLLMKKDISLYKEDAQEYILNLQIYLRAELFELQNVIRQRVFDDVKYSFEKIKKRASSSRIKTIIQTAIKDGIIDIIRDYRYKFVKKSQTIVQMCEQKYQNLGFVIEHKNEFFDTKSFLEENFKSGFLTTSNDILITNILDELASAKESKLNQFNRLIEEHISNHFQELEGDIQQKASSISSLLIDEFIDKISKPIDILEQKLKKEEELLEKKLNGFDKNEEQKEEIRLDLHKKIKKLEKINKGLKG